MITGNNSTVNSGLATTNHDDLLSFCLLTVRETLCMHDLSFEFLLIREFRDVWKGVHASADDDVIKLFGRFLGSLLVADVPSFTVWDNILYGRVEFAMRVDILFFGEALNVILDLWPAWEVVASLFFWLSWEPWELVKVIWDLKSKLCIVAPPNSTDIWFLLEDGWLKIQIL